MKQGQIDRFVIEPVVFGQEHGGGNGYTLHLVMNFAGSDEEPELLQVGTAIRVESGCDNMAQLFHDIAREIKKLPKEAPVNNKPRLRSVS